MRIGQEFSQDAIVMDRGVEREGLHLRQAQARDSIKASGADPLSEFLSMLAICEEGSRPFLYPVRYHRVHAKRPNPSFERVLPRDCAHNGQTRVQRRKRSARSHPEVLPCTCARSWSRVLARSSGIAQLCRRNLGVIGRCAGGRFVFAHCNLGCDYRGFFCRHGAAAVDGQGHRLAGSAASRARGAVLAGPTLTIQEHLRQVLARGWRGGRRQYQG